VIWGHLGVYDLLILKKSEIELVGFAVGNERLTLVEWSTPATIIGIEEELARKNVEVTFIAGRQAGSRQACGHAGSPTGHNVLLLLIRSSSDSFLERGIVSPRWNRCLAAFATIKYWKQGRSCQLNLGYIVSSAFLSRADCRNIHFTSDITVPSLRRPT